MKKYLLISSMVLLGLAVSCKGPQAKQGNTPPDTPLTVNAPPPASTASGAVSKGVLNTVDYEITIPEGWDKKDQVGNGYTMVLLVAPRVDNYSPNLNILKENMKGKTLDEYIKVNLEKMASMNLTDQKSGDLEVNGVKGKFLTYSYTIAGRNVAIKSYVLPKNGVATILTGTCLTSQAADYMPIFDKTVNSLKLK